jgi:hypothetical protein
VRVCRGWWGGSRRGGHLSVRERRLGVWAGSGVLGPRVRWRAIDLDWETHGLDPEYYNSSLSAHIHIFSPPTPTPTPTPPPSRTPTSRSLSKLPPTLTTALLTTTLCTLGYSLAGRHSFEWWSWMVRDLRWGKGRCGRWGPVEVSRARLGRSRERVRRDCLWLGSREI